jgi:hypothetical protein
MSIVSKIIGTGLFFLFTIATGIWLSNSGKPLNTFLLCSHFGRTSHMLPRLSDMPSNSLDMYTPLSFLE